MEEYIYPNFPNGLVIKSQVYFNRYLRFIDSREEVSGQVYSEKHHKVPKALLGSNKKENLIELSGREHYIAHMILHKAFGSKMTNAFWSMNSSNKYNNSLNAKQYERLKIDFSRHISEVNKNPSAETREKMRKASKIRSPEARKKMGDPHRGVPRSEEVRDKINKAHTGKKHSLKHRKNWEGK